MPWLLGAHLLITQFGLQVLILCVQEITSGGRAQKSVSSRAVCDPLPCVDRCAALAEYALMNTLICVFSGLFFVGTTTARGCQEQRN